MSKVSTTAKKRRREKRKKYFLAQKASKYQLSDKYQEQGYRVTEDNKLEHRVIWEKEVGKIPRGWVIHHLNEDKSDNELDNLVAMPSTLHDKLHKLQRRERVRFTKAQIERLLVRVVENENILKEKIKETSKTLKKLNKQLSENGLILLEAFVKSAPLRPPVVKKAVEKQEFKIKTVLRKPDSEIVNELEMK